MPLWQAYTPAPHHAELHLHRCSRGNRLLASLLAGRRHLSRRQPHAGHSALELSDQIAAHSAMVSGRRRAHLHHAQVSAELSECSEVSTAVDRYRRRNLCVEFFAAGRSWRSLLHTRQAVDRSGRERQCISPRPRWATAIPASMPASRCRWAIPSGSECSRKGNR